VADRLDDGVPHREDRALARGAQPEVALLLQEADAVLLGLDRIARLALEHPELRDLELVSERAPRILRHLPAHLDRGFLGSLVPRGEDRLGHVPLRDHGLDDPGSGADLEEVKLAARPLAVEPAAQQHLLAVVRGDVSDVDLMLHGGGGYYCQRRRASSTT